MIARASLVIGCAAILFLLPVPAAHAEPVTFAVLGDTPYDDAYPGAETQSYLDMLAEIGRSDARFVVHIGDIKHGSTPCKDALFEQRRAEFEPIGKPLVFVFGDNEWTDCWRSGSDPLERLTRLRSVFAAGDTSLGPAPFALQRQSSAAAYASYRENTRWTIGNVLFVGVNVPGSNNNFRRLPEEYRARNAAVLAWLSEAFGLARAKNFAAVILFMHADPYLPQARPNGYTELLQALREHMGDYSGLVALVHGDTHTCRIDFPLWDPVKLRYFSNFRRVETFGSPSVNWLRITLESDRTTPQLTVTPDRWSAACCRRDLGQEACG